MALQASANALFCRLCLEELDMVYMFSSDPVTRMVILDNFPKMNLGATNFIRLCKDCYTNLDFVMTVKSGFPLQRKDFLQQKFSRAAGVKFCAFCLAFQANTSEESIFSSSRYGPTRVQKIVEYVIPAFKYIKAQTNICHFCWSWILKIYSFKQQCNQIDNFLLQACHESHLNVLTDTNIYTLVMLNVQVRTVREQIQREKQQTIDLGQHKFQSYISRANANFSKLVLALESNTEHVRMNFDMIRHMEYNFATGEDYPNFTVSNNPGTDVPPVAPCNFVQTYENSLTDNKGLCACNINLTKESIPTIDLNDSDEETVIYRPNEDLIFANDDTLSSDEVKSMDLDIVETDLKLQLCEAENDTTFGNDEGFEAIRSDFDLDAELQGGTSELEIEASGSAPAAKEDKSCNIEEEIATFHIHAELLTEFIDGYAQQACAPLETSNPTFGNCAFVETLRQADVPFSYNPVDANEDDCYQVEADLNQPIDLTLRSCQAKLASRNSHFLRECWGCYVCAAKFRSKGGIIRHTLLHERPCNKFGKFFCRFCPYRANWKGSVTRHQSVHAFENLPDHRTIKYLCIFCNVICSAKEDVQTHMIKHIITSNHFQCLHCMFVGNCSKSLRIHYRNFHIVRA
ncbi:uncharacterized protein LOC109545349 isoform X1 [Dendroctonus ponderosae]|uniref:uncharacterized protein LOC109545349 isoform X1 n=1 Tax=Dendroctonus ponderosae TaxID=77166 RepID=UPI002034C148|nr:uncharacterized protein LOC109545349 isoform X1 [Dendroctonus ponderosae]